MTEYDGWPNTTDDRIRRMTEYDGWPNTTDDRTGRLTEFCFVTYVKRKPRLSVAQAVVGIQEVYLMTKQIYFAARFKFQSQNYTLAKTGSKFGHQTADRSLNRSGLMTELIVFCFGHPSRSVNTEGYREEHCWLHFHYHFLYYILMTVYHVNLLTRIWKHFLYEE